jgi:sarcosine oxidase subunit gamma
MRPLAVLQRRSPVHEALEKLQPVWVAYHDAAFVLHFGATKEKESEYQQSLALCDLSCLPKLAVKGSGTVGWLQSAGVPVPEDLFGMARLPGAGHILRTDLQEFFVEDGFTGQWVAELARGSGSKPAETLLLNRQEASFLLCGSKMPSLLRETCGYHVNFDKEEMAFTRVAGVSCMLLSGRSADSNAVRIWMDPSYAPYLWETLLEIAQELGGSAVGIGCLARELGIAHT